MDVHSSVPSSPVLSHKQIHLSHKSTSDGDSMQRAANLDELREQLQAAKIPVTKRASIAELPQSADDCQLIPGTTRCSLSLCEDSCTQRHQHHRTHAKPLAAGAPLIYARPSISMAQGLSSYVASPADSSPAGSMPPSTNTSPQQQYRRASAFGFNFAPSSGGNAAHHRGSLVSSGFFPTPAEDFTSGPPSPFSEHESSALSSAANSPREKATTTGASSLAAATSTSFVPTLPDFSQPIKEESKMMDDASAAFSGVHVSAPAQHASLDTDYWKLRNHIVRLSDYAPGSLGLGTEESRSRTDLAAAPRDDFPDQEDCSWDPRSPQPPSPVEMRAAQVLQVNMNQQDRTKPEIEFVIKPQI